MIYGLCLSSLSLRSRLPLGTTMRALVLEGNPLFYIALRQVPKSIEQYHCGNQCTLSSRCLHPALDIVCSHLISSAVCQHTLSMRHRTAVRDISDISGSPFEETTSFRRHHASAGYRQEPLFTHYTFFRGISTYSTYRYLPLFYLPIHLR